MGAALAWSILEILFKENMREQVTTVLHMPDVGMADVSAARFKIYNWVTTEYSYKNRIFAFLSQWKSTKDFFQSCFGPIFRENDLFFFICRYLREKTYFIEQNSNSLVF